MSETVINITEELMQRCSLWSMGSNRTVLFYPYKMSVVFWKKWRRG